MNKFEIIKSKNIDEFAEWMAMYCTSDYSPWIKWWDNNYCKKCEAVYHEGKEYGWCELNDKCIFFKDMDDVPNDKQMIKMWLELEVQELSKCLECNGLGFVTNKDDGETYRCECVRCGGSGSVKEIADG